MSEKRPIIHIEPEKNTKKSGAYSIMKQIIASIVILVVLFILMNFPAYYQITKSKFENFLGSKEESPLVQLTHLPKERPIAQNLTSVISINDFIETEKSPQIPKLDLEILPTTNRIVIPRINQNVPIIRVSSENLLQRDWRALERDIQDALRDGVVHYPGTSLPGENGNVVITGHSSYFPWDPGRFKDVFALLHDIEEGDRIVLYFNQQKFVYEVTEKFEVRPTQIEVLTQKDSETLTLITCTPIGSNLRRLIVIGKPVTEDISPSTEIGSERISR